MAEITRSAIHDVIRKAIVPVDSILGRTKLSIDDVAHLKVGDVIQLDSSPHDLLNLEIGGYSRFNTAVGRRREQTAVQLVSFTKEQ
jgi:flagellar motor switch protein FliM